MAFTHVVRQADVGPEVVLEGMAFWACVWVEGRCLDWIELNAERLVRQHSLGTTCLGVLQDHLRFVGPVSRARRCSTEGIDTSPVVFLEVTTEPRIPGQDVWPVVANNIWQREQAAVMCAALQGHAVALPRGPAAEASNKRLAAPLAMLRWGSRAWCWVILVLEPHASTLCVYDRGGVLELTLCPADLEAIHRL